MVGPVFTAAGRAVGSTPELPEVPHRPFTRWPQPLPVAQNDPLFHPVTAQQTHAATPPPPAPSPRSCLLCGTLSRAPSPHWPKGGRL